MKKKMTKGEMIKTLLQHEASLDTEFVILDEEDDRCEFELRMNGALYMDINKIQKILRLGDEKNNRSS